jgi:hypothetical protein
MNLLDVFGQSMYLRRAGRAFMYREYTSIVPLRLNFADGMSNAILRKRLVNENAPHFIDLKPGLRFRFESFTGMSVFGGKSTYDAQIRILGGVNVENFSSEDVLRAVFDCNDIEVSSKLFIGRTHWFDDWNEDSYNKPLEAVDHLHFTSQDAPTSHKLALIVRGTIFNWYLIVLLIYLVYLYSKD